MTPRKIYTALLTADLAAAEGWYTKLLGRGPDYRPMDTLLHWELFDEGGKGRITLQDLQRVARELGETLGNDELVAMIEEFDLDGDNAISREEFVEICLG